MYIGYLGYVITIFILTGLLILITDVKGFKNANMKKEQKASRFFGWINITIGISLILANWVYQLFIW